MITTRTGALPAFFTHVIGSLPRPAAVIDLHRRRETLPADEFRTALDDVVRFAIRLQELAGLDVLSDGEWRRVQYTDEFLDRIGGFPKVRPYEHAGEKKFHRVCTSKPTATKPVFVEDAKFLKAHTTRLTKFALPSPFLIAIRYWHPDYSADVYPTMQHLMADLSDVLHREAVALADAGIDIVQLDDPALTYFCDRRLMEAGETHDDRLRQRWDADKQVPEAVEFINRIVDGLPCEVHLHCCHSVYKRSSDVTGNYQPLLPRLAEANVDRINLEFAYKGTGEVTDLEHLPARFGVGMGVVDVRSESLQSVEQIAAIAVAGARLLDPKRIALNPDCGFAPDMGEPPTIDEAYTKLCRLTAAATLARQQVGAA